MVHIGAPSAPRTCPQGHAMEMVKEREMYTMAEPYLRVFCDMCHKELRECADGQIYGGCAFAHCDICDYDLCMECFAQPCVLIEGVTYSTPSEENYRVDPVVYGR